METTVVKKLKRSYTAAFKLKVVEHAKKKSKNDASKVFSVDRKRVQEWCKQKDDLMATGRSAKRLSGGGRKPMSQPMEIQLVEYIRSKREIRLRVKFDQKLFSFLWSHSISGWCRR